MEQHFVNFYSPGMLFAEPVEKPIESWDVDRAIEIWRETKWHLNPFGFQFTTRARADDELDSKEVKRSGMYFLGGEVYTLEEVEARNDPADKILLSNMRGNGYKRIVVNRNSFKWTQDLGDDDVVLEVTFVLPREPVS